MSLIDIRVPNIGDFKDVAIIEVLVQPGQRIVAEQSLVTVESDKASMEIPTSHAGVVRSLAVRLGDKVSEGSVVLLLEAAGADPVGALLVFLDLLKGHAQGIPQLLLADAEHHAPQPHLAAHMPVHRGRRLGCHGGLRHRFDPLSGADPLRAAAGRARLARARRRLIATMKDDA